jgi:hypothetical protein
VTEPTDVELRRLLKARSDAAAAAALKSGGHVAPDDLAALNDLVRLLEVRSRPSDAPGPQRSWQLAVLLATTLLVVSLLLFARVPETAIELDVHAVEVSFALPSQQVLLERVDLASIGASGLTRIHLPEELAGSASIGNGAEGQDQAIHILVADEGGRRGSIGISAVVPAANTEVRLRRADMPNQYRLSLNHPHVVMNVDVYGPVIVTVPGVGRQPFDFASPRALALEAGAGLADLDLTFHELGGSIMPQVPIQKLAFFRVAERSDSSVSLVRRLSTLTSGTLYFESLNGEKHVLRAGEALRFGEARGEIRTLQLGKDDLALNFHGRVRGMRTGSDDSSLNLMPTWLEWLKARHGLSLLWGTTFYVFGMALAVLRWLKVSI